MEVQVCSVGLNVGLYLPSSCPLLPEAIKGRIRLVKKELQASQRLVLAVVLDAAVDFIGFGLFPHGQSLDEVRSGF